MNGFINLLKPPGMSSAAAVAVIKRQFSCKVGHAGTLDPEAAGVLPIMLGKATRLLDYFSADGKQYIAHISFTGATDTQDASGTLIDEMKGIPSEKDFLNALDSFTGDILQKPSAYSAVKRDGVPMYVLAREGKADASPERHVRISAIELVHSFEDGFLIRVACSSGTYIRTLCHDIGAFLGCPAHMRFLLRTQSGSFALKDAVPLEVIAKKGPDCILPLDYPLHHYQRYDLKPYQEKAARNGLSWECPGTICKNMQIFRVYLNGSFLGLAQTDGGMMKMKVNCIVE